MNKIDENFDRNASKKGTLVEVTKEEYKENFINAVSSLNDIIYADMNGEENQYTLYFRENPTVGAFYTTRSF
ncbi:MAG: hypothetical protein HFJ34_05730 [Clostridia bacterium]|nr:hypothetical protein [Clostridia bacterium]